MPATPRTRRATARSRVPEPMLEALDREATRCGLTRSECIRALLADALGRRGAWPPPAEGTRDA